MLFFLLINFEMPTIVGISTFMGWKKSCSYNRGARIWKLIVLVPGHCLLICLALLHKKRTLLLKLTSIRYTWICYSSVLIA